MCREEVSLSSRSLMEQCSFFLRNLTPSELPVSHSPHMLSLSLSLPVCVCVCVHCIIAFFAIPIINWHSGDSLALRGRLYILHLQHLLIELQIKSQVQSHCVQLLPLLLLHSESNTLENKVNMISE